MTAKATATAAATKSKATANVLGLSSLCAATLTVFFVALMVGLGVKEAFGAALGNSKETFFVAAAGAFGSVVAAEFGASGSTVALGAGASGNTTFGAGFSGKTAFGASAAVSASGSTGFWGAEFCISSGMFFFIKSSQNNQ